MDRTRGRRRAWFAAGTLALATAAGTTLVAVAPAQADSAVTSGSLHWGFKESFRNYVGNQTAAAAPLPVAQRITLTSPATFNPAVTGTPTTTEEVKRPYAFPAQSGTVDGADDVEVATTGGVSYNFPSHFFHIQIKNPRLVVNGDSAKIYADTVYDATQDFGSFLAGHHEATQVPIAETDTVTSTVSGNQVTVTGTGVTLTAEGAAAVPLYAEGDPLDNFTATAVVQDTAPPTVPNGAVTLSKSAVNPAGDSVTVNGTGFLPTVLATRPPLTGQPGGVYVVFGKFAESWKPSAGAPSASRVGLPADQGGTKWAVLAANMATIGGPNGGAIQLNPDGTFTANLNVKAAWGAVTADTPGTYGIYTYGGAGATSAAYETFTPVTFTNPEAGQDQQQIVATVPAQPGGAFSWTVDATDKIVDLGTMVKQGSYLQATGGIKPVVVTDTRSNQTNSWSVSGQVGDFYAGARSFSGSRLGWTPTVTQAGAGAVVGSAVESGLVSGDGLKTSRVLAAGPDGHQSGSARLGADLDLRIPAETNPGTYRALLTLTAIG
jgi:hypothetical protein